MATRAQIEAKHASKRWWCAGPLVLDQSHRDRATKMYDEALALADEHHDRPGAIAKLRALAGALHAYLQARRYAGLTMEEQRDVLSPEVGDDRLAQLSVKLIRWREGCDEEVTALVQALPYDGRSHSVTCPTCGTVMGYKRPLPDEDRETAVAEALRTLDEVLG